MARWGGWGPNTKYYLENYYLTPLHRKIAFLDSQWTVSEQQLLYDINEDTLVNIADLNYLINNLLSSLYTTVSGDSHYDVNNDGTEDISDVASLIDYILSH